MTGQSDEVHILRRFRGPPTSGNGGYVAGMVAEWIDGPAEVVLLAPIPLEVPLHRRRDDSEVSLSDSTKVYARARPASDSLDLDVPAPPPEAEIEAAAVAFPGKDGLTIIDQDGLDSGQQEHQHRGQDRRERG